MGRKKQRRIRRVGHYSSSHKILLVGEGDFSFSACLARAFRSATNMVAATLESKDTLSTKHWSSKAHVDELKRRGCLVLYEVDVDDMDQHPTLMCMKFDIIIFNFPHAGHYSWLCERHDKLIQKHRELLKAFFESARGMIGQGGEIHVSHRDDYPYDQWKLKELAEKAGLVLKEKVWFEKSDYPGYHNKRGGGIQSNKKFPLKECYTFKFSLKPEFTTHELMPSCSQTTSVLDDDISHALKGIQDSKGRQFSLELTNQQKKSPAKDKPAEKIKKQRGKHKSKTQQQKHKEPKGVKLQTAKSFTPPLQALSSHSRKSKNKAARIQDADHNSANLDHGDFKFNAELDGLAIPPLDPQFFSSDEGMATVPYETFMSDLGFGFGSDDNCDFELTFDDLDNLYLPSEADDFLILDGLDPGGDEEVMATVPYETFMSDLGFGFGSDDNCDFQLTFDDLDNLYLPSEADDFLIPDGLDPGGIALNSGSSESGSSAISIFGDDKGVPMSPGF